MNKILLATLLTTFTITASAQNLNNKQPTKAPQLSQQLHNLHQELNQLKLDMSQLRQTYGDQLNYPVHNAYRWANNSSINNIPKNTLNLSLSDAKPLYVCQTKFKNLGIHPGQLSKQGCVISYGGKSIVQKKYTVLTGTKAIQWHPSNYAAHHYSDIYFGRTYYQKQSGNFPGMVQAENNQMTPLQNLKIIGGYEKMHPLTICRGIYNNTLHLGKVVTDKCNVASGKKEVVLTDYQVLYSGS